MRHSGIEKQRQISRLLTGLLDGADTCGSTCVKVKTAECRWQAGRGVTSRAPGGSYRGSQGGRQDTSLPGCPRGRETGKGGTLPCISFFASGALLYELIHS